tara:strand:- start:299 stop:499 length:201 start_codon:yes stop_codon:yes gene_type:complete
MTDSIFALSNLILGNDNQTVIEEIARIGLELSFHAIGHELDMSDEELLRVRDYLEAKVDEQEQNDD